MANLSVVSPQFCVPDNVKLIIVKPLGITNGNFIVTDEHGNIKFKVKEKLLSLHGRHILLDYDGNPIVTIKKKILSAHKRWQVFKRNSSETADLLFSVKKSSLIQFKTELDVYLSATIVEDRWDFKVVGSWLERSCVIYDRASKPIAHIHKKYTLGSIVLGKDTFDVDVNPKVDHAFIVALVMILYEINEKKDHD